MEDLLISTLEAMGFPVRLQGSLLPEEVYPDHFFTFWNGSADGSGYYDNNEGSILWEFDVNFYSIDPVFVSSKILEAKRLLKAAGFIVNGAGHSVASDEPTHTGRGITALYLQKI